MNSEVAHYYFIMVGYHDLISRCLHYTREDDIRKHTRIQKTCKRSKSLPVLFNKYFKINLI